MGGPDSILPGVDGSFRDPSAVVLQSGGRVFRALDDAAFEDFEALVASGVLARQVSAGRVVATWPVASADVPGAPVIDRRRPHLIEHERIAFVSHPYEWPFSLLKRAAVLHLDLHLDLLRSGFTLADGSAYNIQFRGTRPVFIDIPSVRRYREGEYWAGYRQFCEQFLNPLLLTAVVGIPFHGWYRGTLEGVAVDDVARLLPARAALSWRVLLHVTLHARMTVSGQRRPDAGLPAPGGKHGRPLSRAALAWLLRGMRNWIVGLRPRGASASRWADYSTRTSYAAEEADAKRSFVAAYIARAAPAEVLDLGCNNGVYSEIALAAGAKRVVGLDTDLGALEAAVHRADARSLALLPLVVDAANPSPDQGWNQRERPGLQARATADGLLALAFLHHIVIGRNVPLEQAVRWVVGLAPTGVLEFVPKQDPMVQRMLAHRLDIFPTYDRDSFRRELERSAFIARETRISSSGRTLFEYRR